MGISREYHAAPRAPRSNKLGTALRLAGVMAAILLVALAITAILESSNPEPEQTITYQPSGTVQEILAPLPMQEQGNTGAAQAVQLESFGPVRQTAGAYAIRAYDSTVIRQPGCGQVDLSYFADAAFLGDSLTVGFTDYSINLGGALVCGYTGAGPDSIVNRSSVKSTVRGQEVALDVLAAAQPKKLYVLLGTNTLTTQGAEERFLAYYGQMLDLLRQTLGEECVIYVQSIPPVRPAAVAEKPGLASENLRAVNERLAHLADEKGCVYLDLWEALADGEGNLKEVCSAPDGVHLSAGNGYGAWVTYLRNHAQYNSNNAWVAGSDYAM
ncbi:MAG: GDSL-type esterase/lipase family protein [Faecalibacterium sp.]